MAHNEEHSQAACEVCYQLKQLTLLSEILTSRCNQRHKTNPSDDLQQERSTIADFLRAMALIIEEPFGKLSDFERQSAENLVSVFGRIT